MNPAPGNICARSSDDHTYGIGIIIVVAILLSGFRHLSGQPREVISSGSVPATSTVEMRPFFARKRQQQQTVRRSAVTTFICLGHVRRLVVVVCCLHFVPMPS